MLRFRLLAMRAGSLKFLGNPRAHVPRLYDSDAASDAGLRDCVPTFRAVDVAFRAYGPVDLHG